MPCSTRMRRVECAFLWRSCISSYQSGAFCLFLPEMNVSRSLRPWAGRPADLDLGAVDDAGLSSRSQMIDDFGQGP
jgi:hypothetical protein